MPLLCLFSPLHTKSHPVFTLTPPLHNLRDGIHTGFGESYSYDKLGNLTAKAGVSYAYDTSGGTGKRPHAPTSVGGSAYSYDANGNGNLSTGRGRSYTWDTQNRPLTVYVSMAVNESYAYDADSTRLKRTHAGLTTVYLGGGLWEENFNSSGTSVENRKLYKFGSRTVRVKSSIANGVYLHADGLGSTSLTTLSNQAVSNQLDYDPWGKVIRGTMPETTINYTGQHLDDTGLLYYNARYYDPGVGKFVSPDSIVPNAANPQAFNRYGYAYNNPLRFTDPTGHFNQPIDSDEGGDPGSTGGSLDSTTSSTSNEVSAGVGCGTMGGNTASDILCGVASAIETVAQSVPRAGPLATVAAVAGVAAIVVGLMAGAIGGASTPPPDPRDELKNDQERAVYDRLQAEGYTESPYGVGDKAIGQTLAKSKNLIRNQESTADFIQKKPGTNQFIVDESKSYNHIDVAVHQIRVTSNRLEIQEILQNKTVPNILTFRQNGL